MVISEAHPSARPDRKRFIVWLAVCLLALTLPGCSQRSTGRQTILLISVDGLRWDGLEQAATPNFDRLVATGVRARALIPVFPTKTFPNHYSIVTGLYPENHGIVANSMYDPVYNDTFKLADREAVADGRWWEGEPIWVTAQKGGLLTATLFWVGSEAEIKGQRPTYWQPYDHDLPHRERVAQIISWLRLPLDKRPTFLTLYFHIVDTQAHTYGPTAQQTIHAIQKVDSTLGELFRGLAGLDIIDELNIIVVSDHGMAAIDSTQVIFLDDYIDPEIARVIDWSPILGLRPREEAIDYVFNTLKGAHPQLQIYRREDTPSRLRYSSHHRIPPIIGLADEGWSITTHDYFRRHPENFHGGGHGYDNRYASMGGIFIARGPAFKSGLTVEPFENIHIYNLLAAIMELSPAPNDGDFARVKGLLAP
ncbi:MAG: alkaline phosphatase family protein [Candidatus Marinimicrobia bacterium]|nr:alkaline phosphatase family protein [Candidatus Neomarinimicrobiota bacterium]